MTSRLRRYALLAVVLTVVYHSNLRPIPSGDSAPAALLPFSLALDHQITFDRFAPWIQAHDELRYAFTLHAGHLYSTYPIAGPLLVSPIYAPAALVPWFRNLPPASLALLARMMEKFTATFLTVATALVLLLLLERILAQRTAFRLALACALGTGLWSTASQALWQHSFGVVAIALWLYAIDRWREEEARARWQWVAGAALGVALAVRPSNALLLAATLPALWASQTRLSGWIRTMLPPLLSGLAVAVYNWSLFHSLAGGYSTSLTSNFWAGLAGILVSPGRGLLFYTPIAAFAVCAFLPAARPSRVAHRPLLLAASAMIGLQFASIAVWPIWWGGYCFGPRLLTEVLPSIAVLLALGWTALRGCWRWAFAAALAASILVQAAGVYSYPLGAWDAKPVSVDTAPARLWDVKDNPLTRAARSGLVLNPYTAIGIVLHHGLGAAATQIDAWQTAPRRQ